MMPEDQSKQDFRVLEEQWQRNEEQLERLKAELNALQEETLKSASGMRYVVSLEREKSLTRQYWSLAHAQNELEAFLIENEAPGWTST